MERYDIKLFDTLESAVEFVRSIGLNYDTIDGKLFYSGKTLDESYIGINEWNKWIVKYPTIYNKDNHDVMERWFNDEENANAFLRTIGLHADEAGYLYNSHNKALNKRFRLYKFASTSSILVKYPVDVIEIPINLIDEDKSFNVLGEHKDMHNNVVLEVDNKFKEFVITILYMDGYSYKISIDKETKNIEINGIESGR